MTEWTWRKWFLGLLGFGCQSVIDTQPQMRCERRRGHHNRHRMGDITWQIGTRGD